jgi:hypothetical protein
MEENFLGATKQMYSAQMLKAEQVAQHPWDVTLMVQAPAVHLI